MTIRTPITLITGSLGSGKTTLLQKILAATPRRLAVLINEFGEIGIDGRVVSGAHTRIIELAGGCVCCELAGEFIAAVRELLARYDPDSIVVEATGVAEADALVYEVEDELPEVRLDSVICVVDADTSIRYPQVGYVSRVQLRQADIILINKSDLVSREQMAAVRDQVRAHNRQAAIVATAFCAGVEDLLLSPRPSARRPAATAAPAARVLTAGLQSFAYASNRVIGGDLFEKWAGNLPSSVYRAKGLVVLDSGSHLFNYVAGRWELEPFDASTTELVFIGSGIGAAREAIIGGLEPGAKRS